MSHIDRCPACGAPVKAEGAGACAACGQPFTQREGMVSFHWSQSRGETVDRWSTAWWGRTLRHMLDPIGSPFSPVAWATRYKVNAYYERCHSHPETARRFHDSFFGQLALPHTPDTLDCGCGAGRHTAMLRQLGHNVTGQDIIESANWARIPGARFVVAPPHAQHLPYPDASFDLVLVIEMLNHLPPERLAALAGDVARVLRPGGFWCILEGHSGGYDMSFVRNWCGRLYAVEDYDAAARNAGLALHQSRYVGFNAPVLARYVNAVRVILNPFATLDDPELTGLCGRLIPERRRPLYMAAYRKDR